MPIWRDAAVCGGVNLTVSDGTSDDYETLRRVKAGDREAFGELVSRYMRRAYNGAMGLVGSHDDALDLSQEAFARAFKARSTIDPDRPFYTWYYQILRRLCFNRTRDSRTRREKLETAETWLVAESEQRGPAMPHDAVELSERQERLQDAVESLPMNEREVIVLREFQDFSYKEIAHLLDIPTLAVFGELDLQVPAEMSANGMARAFKASGNERARIETLSKANHLFQSATTGSPSEYTTLPKEFVPELLPLMTAWIKEVI